ncbi:chemerin-like receptor 1 [Lates japonicus]|uniref:Chemerin-like receptor 1 n=1 Tax=Lates japonicus TaxID=270547 RepID=A0AAD3N3M4_LATJO|nr:chemerin-like receptor 1 [Lates japonicus]
MRWSKKRTAHMVWYLNLAVADLLFTALLPFSVMYVALDFHWPFSKLMCKLSSTSEQHFLNMFASVCFASVYIEVVISLDRFLSVVWPVWTQNHQNV